MKLARCSPRPCPPAQPCPPGAEPGGPSVRSRVARHDSAGSAGTGSGPATAPSRAWGGAGTPPHLHPRQSLSLSPRRSAAFSSHPSLFLPFFFLVFVIFLVVECPSFPAGILARSSPSSSSVHPAPLCVLTASKGGRDISNIRSVRLYIGCPEIFPNKHSLIRLGWADLSTD